MFYHHSSSLKDDDYYALHRIRHKQKKLGTAINDQGKKTTMKAKCYIGKKKEKKKQYRNRNNRKEDGVV